jgi:G3E family GTPase
VITGFLGSGKTTLLGNALTQYASDEISVIINEFGQAGLDHRLIRRVEERTTLLSNGCVCCNRRDDLVTELLAMLNAHQAGELPLERIVIETTGMADPAPVMFSILTHPVLVHHFHIETVIACLDAANGEAHLAGFPEAVKQIAAADKVIITKTDIASPEATRRLRFRVGFINPAARVETAAFGTAPPSMFASLDSAGRPTTIDNRLEGADGEDLQSPTHVSTIRSIAIRFDKALDWLAFGVWLSMLLHHNGEKIMRVKGILDVGEAGPVVLNGVQHIIHPPKHLSDWKEYELRNSQIVFIMRDLEPYRIMDSLTAFQSIIGAAPSIREINSDVLN